MLTIEASAVAELNALWREVDQLTSDAVARGAFVVKKKIELGQRLISLKGEVDHGEWEKWVKDNCDFSLASAVRVMRLARKAESTDLSSATGLTDAYRMAEILPDIEGSNAKGSGTKQENYVIFAQRLEDAIRKLPDVETWSAPEQRAFVQRTDEIARLNRAAREQLGLPPL